MKVGILHPGAMGSALARCVSGSVLWVGAGRSNATRERAVAAGLHDAGSIAEMTEETDIIISVCPPASALDVATEVASRGFGGLYVDANAIAPQTSVGIGALFSHYVDAGLVGPPPTEPGDTRLYLAGSRSEEVAALFRDSAVDARILDGGVGSASALKAAYAGWTKGTSALLMNQAAFASASGVLGPLLDEFAESIPGLVEEIQNTASRIGLKAWRFAGEMDEIADAMGHQLLEPGFHRAAAAVYSRLAPLKGTAPQASLEEVLRLLTGGSEDG